MKIVKPQRWLSMLGGMLGLMAAVPPAQAATFVWDGGSTVDSNWSTTANWNPDGAPVSASDTDIQLAGSARLDSTASAPFTLRSLTFNNGAGAFNLSGSKLTFAYVGGTSTIIGVSSGVTNTQTINNNMDVIGYGDTRVFKNDSTANLILNGNIAPAATNPNLSFTTGVYTSDVRTITVNGNITGGSQVQVDVGTSSYPFIVVLNGNNTFTGNFKLYSGTAKVGNSNALGTSTSDVPIGAGGASRTMALLTIAPVTINRNFFINQSVGTATLHSSTIGGETADASTFSGNITLGRSDGGASGAQPLTVTAATSGTVTFSGNLLQPTTPMSGTTTNAALTKTGLGKVILSGSNNSYVGTTTVTAGTLQVDGTLTSGGGTVTVSSGATLGGIGTIHRALSVAGHLAPGDSIGTLSVDSASFSSGGLFDVQLGAGTSSDILAVLNNLNITNAGLTLSGAGSGSNYVIATYGSLTGSAFASVSGLPTGYGINYGTGTNSQISLVVIPEPASLALLAIGGLLIGFRKGRSV